jgi:FtsZ-binding cell division protein ZapB
LDKEQILIQFEQIERKVERLLNIISSLEESNTELKNQNERLATELNSERELGQNYAEERDQIRTRIDGLLSRLDRFTETP